MIYWIFVSILITVTLFISYNFWLHNHTLLVKERKINNELNSYLYDWSFLNDEHNKYIG